MGGTGYPYHYARLVLRYTGFAVLTLQRQEVWASSWRPNGLAWVGIWLMHVWLLGNRLGTSGMAGQFSGP